MVNVYWPRDPVGVRPLFYTRYGPNSIAFASEAKALLHLKCRLNISHPVISTIPTVMTLYVITLGIGDVINM